MSAPCTTTQLRNVSFDADFLLRDHRDAVTLFGLRIHLKAANSCALQSFPALTANRPRVHLQSPDTPMTTPPLRRRISDTAAHAVYAHKEDAQWNSPAPSCSVFAGFSC